MERMSSKIPIGLILPALYSEFEGPAMPGIIEKLSKVNYLKRIVITLDRATPVEFRQMCSRVERFPTQATVVWNNGDAIQGLLRLLEENGLEFDRHSEEKAVEVFADSLQAGALEYLRRAMPNSLIPNWNRVISAIPDFYDRLLQAVQTDNVVNSR